MTGHADTIEGKLVKAKASKGSAETIMARSTGRQDGQSLEKDKGGSEEVMNGYARHLA